MAIVSKSFELLGFTKAGKVLISSFDWEAGPVFTRDYSAVMDLQIFNKTAAFRTVECDFDHFWLSKCFTQWVFANAISLGEIHKTITITEGQEKLPLPKTPAQEVLGDLNQSVVRLIDRTKYFQNSLFHLDSDVTTEAFYHRQDTAKQEIVVVKAPTKPKGVIVNRKKQNPAPAVPVPKVVSVSVAKPEVVYSVPSTFVPKKPKLSLLQ